MTDDARKTDRPVPDGALAPTVADDPDSPLARLLALAEERPLTEEDFLAVREQSQR